MVNAGRIALLTGAGFLAIALATAIPGRQPPPLPPREPDPAREVTESMTPPRFLGEAKLLSLLGYVASTSPRLEGDVEFRLRVDEQGRVGRFEAWRWSGDDGIAPTVTPVLRYLQFSPALDEAGRPVPVWWHFSISLPAPLVLAPDNQYTRSGVGGPAAPEGGYTVDDLANEHPVFTPLTDLPVVLDPDEVGQAVRRECARLPAGRGARVWPRVFFLLDKDGRVRQTRFHVRSFVKDVDEAALRVASTYRFAAARDGDQPVVAWVSLLVDLSETGCAGGRPR